MLYDAALHTMERRFAAARPEEIGRADVIEHVLDALTFYDCHAMSRTSPFR
jgi:hypothetical protein